MKILFVADVSISRIIGGAERVLFEQTTRFAERGLDVHIMTRKLPDHNHDQDTIQNVHEWRYPINQKNTFSYFKTSRNNGKQLFETLHQKVKFDCINFHQPFSAFGVLKSPLSQKVNKIYTCHSLSFEEFVSRNSLPTNFRTRLWYRFNIYGRKWIENRTLEKSDQIITLSKYTRDKLYDVYNTPKDKIAIIQGGVDLNRFRPTENKIKIRQQLGIPSEKIVLLTVRNQVPRMGLDNLILAMKKVMMAAPKILLVIGGEGPLMDELKALTKKLGVENIITFSGFISEEKLPDYYRMADLFVLPTQQLEGFGLVTLESLASGVPVLGTPVGGTQEILGKFNSEFLFEDSTPDSMADLIIRTCQRIRNDPESWKDLSKQCRSFVEAHYSWEKNIDALENLFFNK